MPRRVSRSQRLSNSHLRMSNSHRLLRRRSAVAAAVSWVIAAVLASGSHAAPTMLDMREGMSVASGEAEGASDTYLMKGLREDFSSLLACALGVLLYHTHSKASEEAPEGHPAEGPADADERAQWDASWLSDGPQADAERVPKLCIPLLWL
mmetsp:Transcript_14093/g.40609  ORF Transcript_14093/g.40609 Transcript_14093/m.40609 type:complete len:151 (+) Transcript_14093:249-701(+)